MTKQMNKKVPMRSCVVTREKLPKKELIRIVNTKDGVCIDLSGHINGRGAYIKRDIDVLNKAKSTKVLERTLGCPIDSEIYEKLEEIISSK